MAKTGKRLKKAYEGIDPTVARPLDDALKLIKERATAKFDETVEVAMNLNIDPRKPDQNLRGAVHAAARHRQDACGSRSSRGATGPRKPRRPGPTSSGPRISPRRCRPARSISTARSRRRT